MRIQSTIRLTYAILFIFIIFFTSVFSVYGETTPIKNGVKILRELTLEQCLETALQNNQRRPASLYAVEMAEARHRQALAAYWPQIGANIRYMQLDESPNFLFPASSFSLPAQTISLPPGFSIPVTGPGGITIPLTELPIPAQDINIPAQDIKLMDRDSYHASLNTVWLLYDGGMRKGYREQSDGLVGMMKQEARRTDLEITDSVTRYYYGAVLARQLHQLGFDTLARMEATLNLTETMYKEGSGKIKKTDWLDNKVMVEGLRSIVALLEKNETMAQAALGNTMGLPWHAGIKPADQNIPYAPLDADLDDLVGTAYAFSPDWAKIEAGLLSAEGALRTARSGYFPKLAVTGNLHKWWNDHESGIATDRNKEGWTLGVGMEIPLFSGFLTRNQVTEALSRVKKIQHEQLLVKDAIGLQVKDVFSSLHAAQKSYQATFDAMQAAVENRDLNTRAYQHELVETEKVIRAQLIDALMTAQHFKVCFDHMALQSRLNLLVGTEVIRKMDFESSDSY